jgi:hypothetical protein
MATAAECVPNIGPAGRRQRMWFGAVSIGLAVASAIALVVLDVARPWRLGVLLPFVAGAFGIFQARAKT